MARVEGANFACTASGSHEFVGWEIGCFNTSQEKDPAETKEARCFPSSLEQVEKRISSGGLFERGRVNGQNVNGGRERFESRCKHREELCDLAGILKAECFRKKRCRADSVSLFYVGKILGRGKHDYRKRAKLVAGTEPSQYFKSIFAWHFEVENEERGERVF